MEIKTVKTYQLLQEALTWENTVLVFVSIQQNLPKILSYFQVFLSRVLQLSPVSPFSFHVWSSLLTILSNILPLFDHFFQQLSIKAAPLKHKQIMSTRYTTVQSIVFSQAYIDIFKGVCSEDYRGHFSTLKLSEIILS